MADPAEDLDSVRLDLHARASAITLLPAMQLVIDLFDVDRHAGGQTFDYRDQCATV
jgi:hypothetical protein